MVGEVRWRWMVRNEALILARGDLNGLLHVSSSVKNSSDSSLTIDGKTCAITSERLHTLSITHIYVRREWLPDMQHMRLVMLVLIRGFLCVPNILYDRQSDMQFIHEPLELNTLTRNYRI